MLKRPERDLSGADGIHLLSVEEVSRLLYVGVTLVRKLIDSGILPSLTIGRTRRVRLDDLRTFVEQQAVSAADGEHRYRRIVGRPAGTG